MADRDCTSEIEIRELEDYPGYGVSADGRAWCRKRRGQLPKGCTSRLGNVWRPLRLVREPDGYLQISIVVNGKVTTPRVHRLVLRAFVGPRPDDYQCRHLNGNRADNRLENLAWGTPVENSADRDLHGTALRGEKSPNAMLTEEKVRTIKRMLRKGFTQRMIGLVMGVSEPAIGAIATNRNWKHVT